MKGTITQYIMLGIMLLLMVLIVSLYPKQAESKATSSVSPSAQTRVSSLTLHTHIKAVRAD